MRLQRGLHVSDNFEDNFHGARKTYSSYIQTHMLYVETTFFMSGHNSEGAILRAQVVPNLCFDTTFYVRTQLFMLERKF